MEEQKGDLCVVFEENLSECRLLLVVADCRLLLLGGEYLNTLVANKYTLLDGYFASCVVFFRAPQGRGKMRAMSKLSASIIC